MDLCDLHMPRSQLINFVRSPYMHLVLVLVDGSRPVHASGRSIPLATFSLAVRLALACSRAPSIASPSPKAARSIRKAPRPARYASRPRMRLGILGWCPRHV